MKRLILVFQRFLKDFLCFLRWQCSGLSNCSLKYSLATSDVLTMTRAEHKSTTTVTTEYIEHQVMWDDCLFMWAEFQFFFLLIIVSCSRHPIFSDVSSTLAGNNWTASTLFYPRFLAAETVAGRRCAGRIIGWSSKLRCRVVEVLDLNDLVDRIGPWTQDATTAGCVFVGWMGKISSLKSSVLRTLLCKVLNDILRGKHFVKIFHIKQRT